MSALLDDLISGDPERTIDAARSVRKLWDEKELDALAPGLDLIKEKTKNLELGGLLYPNAAYLKQAIKRIEHHRDKWGCLCRCYIGSDMEDPEEEQRLGHVKIESKTTENGGYDTKLLCVCVRCGARFDVEGHQSHYMWWSWSHSS